VVVVVVDVCCGFWSRVVRWWRGVEAGCTREREQEFLYRPGELVSPFRGSCARSFISSSHPRTLVVVAVVW
jgi:hypothetical protein